MYRVNHHKDMVDLKFFTKLMVAVLKELHKNLSTEIKPNVTLDFLVLSSVKISFCLLSRENQMLQVKQSNIQSRKWTNDSETTNCSSCVKQFSITVRKHHCRNCGGVFCAECTENTANVPSFKKPQRVCEICFNELKNA